MQISTPTSTKAMRLAGALEIYDAELVRQSLLQALPVTTELVLDLEAVESCDTAGAQLLVSAHKSALKAGKPIRFENIPQTILDFWARIGLPAAFFADPRSNSAAASTH